MRLIPRRRPLPAPKMATIEDDDGVRLGALRWHDSRLKARSQFSSATWQNEVLDYVDDGPGRSGWLVEQVAKLLGGAEVMIEEFDPATSRWEQSDYGPAHRIMARVRTADGDVHDLVEKVAEDLEAVAETHLWLDQDSRHGWIYGAATSNQIERRTQAGDERVIIRDRPDAEIGDREYRSVPISSVVSLIWGSAKWPGVPGNQMRRALPDLRAYAKAVRAVDRAFDSRLIMNGVIGFEFPAGTPQAVAEEVKKNWVAWSSRGFTTDDSIAAHVPFLAIGAKVSHADTGHDTAVENIEAAVGLLTQWAGNFDLPTDWIVKGPGQGKFANEALTREEVLTGSVEPRERRVMGMLTETILRPWGRNLSIFDRDPSLFRARLDIGSLATPEDKTTDIIAMADRIGIRREVQARQVGLDETDLIPLPPGMTEVDLWQMALASRSAPGAPASSPTGRGPGQGIQAALPIRAALGVDLDDVIVDAELVPHDDERDAWHDDDALLV